MTGWKILNYQLSRKMGIECTEVKVINVRPIIAVQCLISVVDVLVVILYSMSITPHSIDYFIHRCRNNFSNCFFVISLYKSQIYN